MPNLSVQKVVFNLPVQKVISILIVIFCLIKSNWNFYLVFLFHASKITILTNSPKIYN